VVEIAEKGVAITNVAQTTDMASLLAMAEEFTANPTASPQDLADALEAKGGGTTVIVGSDQLDLSGKAGSAPAPRGDSIDKLEWLAKLRDAGVLTETEFQAQKARVLGESA
jgi:hypothetical protein